MIVVLCDLVLISMVIFYSYWRGFIAIDVVMIFFLCIIFVSAPIVFFEHINVSFRLKLLNDFLVDNRDYVNNNSLKYYDKERGKSEDKLFEKHIDYISENKIQVSLSKFNKDACEKTINFMNSWKITSSRLFEKHYNIKIDTLIADKSLFCKNKENKITYTIMIKS